LADLALVIVATGLAVVAALRMAPSEEFAVLVGAPVVGAALAGLAVRGWSRDLRVFLLATGLASLAWWLVVWGTTCDLRPIGVAENFDARIWRTVSASAAAALTMCSSLSGAAFGWKIRTRVRSLRMRSSARGLPPR
jgi:hypothetical protein